jgi:ribosomal protein S18 acetylase RimI-like enzyme
MTDYKIRPAAKDDFMLSFEIRKNALGEYVRQTWGWDEEMQMKYHKEDFNTDILSIIEVNGEPVGTLEYYYDDHSMIISGIYITDKFQNCGIGTDILLNLHKEAEVKGKQVRLQVLKVNTKAKKLYEKLGYSVYNISETHYQLVYNKQS